MSTLVRVLARVSNRAPRASSLLTASRPHNQAAARLGRCRERVRSYHVSRLLSADNEPPATEQRSFIEAQSDPAAVAPEPAAAPAAPAAPQPIPAPEPTPLASSNLRWTCSDDLLAFNTTEDESLAPLDGVIGQERALNAIELGLGVDARGYNLFLTGLAGTGRLTTIRSILDSLSMTTEAKLPDDQLFVQNFSDPDVPRHISLPAGKGKEFAEDMKQLINGLSSEVKALFEGPQYEQAKKQIEEDSTTKQREILVEFEKLVEPDGMVLFQVQGLAGSVQLQVVPFIKGKPIRPHQLEGMVDSGELSKEELESYREKIFKYSNLLEVEVKRVRLVQVEAMKRLEQLDADTSSPLMKQKVNALREKYPFEQLKEYFDELTNSLCQNAQRFRFAEKPDANSAAAVQNAGAGGLAGLQALLSGAGRSENMDFMSEYNVNLLVDNSQSKTRPVVFETHPTYKNLFGTIERVFSRTGLVQTGFSNIKAGSLLKANGGFLVLNARDALSEHGVWPALKRSLRNGTLEMQTSDYFFTTALKPQPIPISVKVIMIGEGPLYNLLSAYDEDFAKIFKVKVGFDYETNLNSVVISKYASFIKFLCNQSNFRHVDRGGVAEIVENAVRSAGRQNKISTQLSSDVHDVIAEANFWAQKDSSKFIKREHVQKAIANSILRLSLAQEKLFQMIKQGYLLISVDGAKVGQVNALSIFKNGPYKFGRPSRITAVTSLGRNGIIDIEREAKLTGAIHTKGVLILSSYLRHKYAQSKLVLTLSASIAFEQSYGSIDGDSASSTEAYAILSSLSGLPIKQNIAVTGSISQVGEIQPIGGVNEKIEGFFDTCQLVGFTGTQGCLIPTKNIPDLMLRADVVQAVAEGKFHIYSAETVDQGIEILTGVKAGALQADGTYEPNTVHGKVYERLLELAKVAAQSPAANKDTNDNTKVELAKMLLKQAQQAANPTGFASGSGSPIETV